MHAPAGLVALALLAALSLFALPGCGGKKTVADPVIVATPPATFTGPDYLRGTVGSLCALERGSGEPLLIGGYGLVFLPPGQGTGSSEVPADLRQRLIQAMRRRGIGSPSMLARAPEYLKPFLSLSPERVLDLNDTVVVRVEGLIPPGATKGTKFDLLVTALDSQTTSLTGGTLFTVDLGFRGWDRTLPFVHTLAEGYGPLYVDPKRDAAPSGSNSDFRRAGVVVLGGQTVVSRPLTLLLNQPSWTRSRAIANRINERLGRNSDPKPVAEPKTDLRIQINVPSRWSNRPSEFLDLVAHLFVEQGPSFTQGKARELAAVLRAQPEAQADVVSTWRALGPNALPVLRDHYGDSTLHLRLAALEAGAWLDDAQAGRHLSELASHPEATIRARIADALAHLPTNIEGNATLRRLLDDTSEDVRIAAYESLASINARDILGRVPVSDGRAVKFIIDRVPSEKPLIYVAQRQVPRVVVFGPHLGFEAPMIGRVWDNRLMLKLPSPQGPLDLFYQPAGAGEPVIHRLYPFTVATLAYALGHSPHEHNLHEGLGLTFGQVADAIFELTEAGHIKAPLRFEESPLARAVEEMHQQVIDRPELSPPPEMGGVGVPGISGAELPGAALPGAELPGAGAEWGLEPDEAAILNGSAARP